MRTLELPDFSLLRFDSFDQQYRQPGMVHALNFMRVGVTRHYLENDQRPKFFRPHDQPTITADREKSAANHNGFMRT